MRISHFKQAGDTIVEVMIAVVVISAMLVGAFLVTSSSTRAVRDSEEHSEALQYLQGQVELLRAAADVPGTLGPHVLNKAFCLGPGATITYYLASDTHCQVGSIPGGYDLSIIGPALLPPSGSATSTFDLTAQWAAIGGGNDEVYLSYKVAVQ